MTTQANIPGIERPKFFKGQQLTANDLAELQRVQRELRWLHNRSVHGWGIGIGLDVIGETGDGIVVVEPGYATDCLGREAYLTKRREITVPSVAKKTIYFLVAGYLPDEDQKIAQRRPGVCMPEGTVRLSEDPRIEWKTADKLQAGIDIVLAEIEIMNCQLSRPPSLAPRRYARPANQPYIAAGQTINDDTTQWRRLVQDDDSVITRRVDTASARFRTTPYYQAHVTGDRHIISGDKITLINGTSSIADVTPTGFSIQVQFNKEQITVPPLSDDLLDIVNDRLEWNVVWMGIEG